MCVYVNIYICIYLQTLNNLVDLLQANNITIITQALYESDYRSQLLKLKVIIYNVDLFILEYNHIYIYIQLLFNKLKLTLILIIYFI